MNVYLFLPLSSILCIQLKLSYPQNTNLYLLTLNKIGI